MNVSSGRIELLDEHASGRLAWLGALAVLLAIAATVALALYQFVPPAVVPADAPATEFSAERAMSHLEVIAREPHPVGLPENARVREYILKQLRAIGLRPKVQKATVYPVRPGGRARHHGEQHPPPDRREGADEPGGSYYRTLRLGRYRPWRRRRR